MSIERRDMFRPSSRRVVRISETVLKACTKRQAEQAPDDEKPCPQITRGCNLIGALESGDNPYECSLREEFGRDEDGKPIVTLICEEGQMTDSRSLAHARDAMCHKVYRMIEGSYKRPHTYDNQEDDL